MGASIKETIKLALVENNCGSRIIITTRKLEVAKQADQVYKLEPLSHGNSKKLLYTRLFDGEDKRPSNHPDDLSDMVLKKCGGIPLAIITMASLLLGKSEQEWIEVCNSPGFYQDKDNRHMENTMHILSLSYYDLPCHLKTCLLYLSVFPEDSLIYKHSVIWMWIAEGFVDKKPGRGLFEVGEEYFHDLINRSLIQAVDSHVYVGIIDGCRVHDMVLDLIVNKSHEENFVFVDGTLPSQRNTRRLVLKNRELDLVAYSTHVNLIQVRSLIVSRCAIDKWALHPSLKLIRVLALEHCTFGFREECHDLEPIGKLLHLRYLRIQGRGISKLSDKIGDLKFLQTLDVNYSKIQELPYGIGNLTQLVCLRAPNVSVPVGVVGNLTTLEELQLEKGESTDEHWRQLVKDLGNLCELRVLELHFGYKCVDDSMQTNFMQSLGNLQKMQHLTLGGFYSNVSMKAWDAAVLSRDLQFLFLPSIWFPKLPSWINSAHLPRLSHLDIHVKKVDDEGLKTLGGFPELCYLKLETRSRATITSTTNTEADGFFQKLRYLKLPNSMVQFVAMEDSSTLFTICDPRCNYKYIFRMTDIGGMAIGESRKEDKSRVVVPTSVVMPSLEELLFCVTVASVRTPFVGGFIEKKVVGCGDLGWEYLPSIRKVKAYFVCDYAYEDDVEREEAALRHAIDVHPNHPAHEIKLFNEDRMKRWSQDDGASVSTTE